MNKTNLETVDHLPAIDPEQKGSRKPCRFSGMLATIPVCLLAILFSSGCASTKVGDRQKLVDEKLPRPGQVLVYDFATSAAEVPTDSTLAQEFTVESEDQTPEAAALGRELGSAIAAQLVASIREMGMPAQQVSAGVTPQVNDIVIRGYLVSVKEGSTAKRVAIGFGSGKSELHTVVEGFQATPQGLRKLGSGTVKSGGGKGPGTAVGAATWLATSNPAGLIVSSGMNLYGELSGKSKIEGRAKSTAREIAEVLEKRFKEQQWIQ